MQRSSCSRVDIGYRWFNGTGIPLGPDATTEERFMLNADGSRLDYTMTVTDSATFTAPVTLRKAWEWRPGEQSAYDAVRVRRHERGDPC